MTSLAGIAAQIETLVAARASVASDYASTFKRNMDVYIAGLTDDVALTRRRLELERTEAQRVSAIAARGAASQSAVEAATSRVADLERTVVNTQSKLDQAVRNRRAADQGLFFLDDGSDGSTAQRTLEDARLNLQRARADLANAHKDAEAAQRVVDEASRLFGHGQTANAEGLPGGTVWSQTVSHGAAVEPGAPAATWVDCRVLLVDTPVSDVELSLLRPGLPADVVLEGERRSRRGSRAADPGRGGDSRTARSGRPGQGPAAGPRAGPREARGRRRPTWRRARSAAPRSSTSPTSPCSTSCGRGCAGSAPAWTRPLTDRERARERSVQFALAMDIVMLASYGVRRGAGRVGDDARRAGPRHC